MNKHPDVYVVDSEVHFFDYYTSPSRTKSKYFSLFTKAKAGGKRVRGEKSPEYIYIDYCAEAIRETCPHSKFLLLLRDPIARAFSHWNMNVKKGIETRRFEECVKANLSPQGLAEVRSNKTSRYHYVQRGFYMDQIDRFQQVFPDRTQMLVVISEQIKRDPDTEFEKIFRFLGVSPAHIDAEEEYVGSYQETMDATTLRLLKRVYKSHNKRLERYIGCKLPWN